MLNTEKICDTLTKQFDFLQGQTIIQQRPRRMNIKVSPENLREVLLFAVKLLDFNFISAMTGLDEEASFTVIYHLANQQGVLLNIRISIPKEQPVIATVTDIFPSVDIYERELIDLLGIQVTGLTPGFKYPLPDDWPAGQYPLRKDWKGLNVTEAPAQEGEANAS